MSGVSNALNMYFILQNCGMKTGDELAEILGVTPRMISQYKDDLEMAGIYIGSKRGRYGGYYLEKGVNLNRIYLSEDEKKSFKLAGKILESENHPYSLEYDIGIGKILSFEDSGLKNIYIRKSIKISEEREKIERKMMIDIEKAIKSNKKVEIIYNKIGENEDIKEKRIVHPYNIFSYMGSRYLAGFCEKRKDFRYFKFNRFEDYKVSNEEFNKENYNLEENFGNSFGIVNDRVVDLKLKIRYPYSTRIKENIYSANQEIIDLDNNKILFKAKMTGYMDILDWVKSMGSHVEVLEPRELREDIIKDLKKTIDIYK